ncbi:LysR substrate-binding domain-containing protein [Azospirillum himalayense]|uniref:LysR substrate-binding domain-containing protein n=1 Tax=Azospirillum himalayense TaxID=654847 RepID=A0ABW0GAN3_9PROT
MTRNLPLTTLRAFDAAARHQSLAKAAQELNLTDSAVSHQLRRLEGALGVALFEKAGRGVVLTDAGRIFARSVGGALQDIDRTALGLVDGGTLGGRLTIACSPMFASKWLAKNLAAFCGDHSGVECHIQLAENSRVVEVTDADVGIQFGGGSWKGKWSALLENVTLGPACSPRLFSKAGRGVATPSDLRDVVLIHQDDGTEWRRWLAEEGEHDFDSYRRNIYCSDLSVAIDLAVEGVGLVLVSDTLSSSHIAEETLLRPFGGTIMATGGWYVLCDGAKLERPNTRLFIDWLLGRFGKTLALSDDQAWEERAVASP